MDQTNNEKLPKVLDIQAVDASKYLNVRVSNQINWFHALIAICLSVSGIFLGIILCCLMVLFV